MKISEFDLSTLESLSIEKKTVFEISKCMLNGLDQGLGPQAPSYTPSQGAASCASTDIQTPTLHSSNDQVLICEEGISRRRNKRSGKKVFSIVKRKHNE